MESSSGFRVLQAPDVKELTPEFFLPSPAFLTNRLQLALGTRQVSPGAGFKAVL